MTDPSPDQENLDAFTPTTSNRAASDVLYTVMAGTISAEMAKQTLAMSAAMAQLTEKLSQAISTGLQAASTASSRERSPIRIEQLSTGTRVEQHNIQPLLPNSHSQAASDQTRDYGQIFGQAPLPGEQSINYSTLGKGSTRSRLRRIAFNRQTRAERQMLLETVIGKLHDFRPYAQVTLLGNTVVGLLDTGASVCCIGGHLAKDVMEKTEYKRLSATGKTADGKSQDIIGRLTTEVSYRGESKKITFFLVPSLSGDLYLGIDFWKAFNLLPVSLLSEQLSVVSLSDPLRHWLVGTHASRLGAPYNDFCRSCRDEDEEETVEHLICSCPALRRRRLHHLGSAFLNHIWEMSTLCPRKIANFIRASVWVNC
ncbi:GL15379 [Drosophila persimilis]|uniref:GL15379 n=1 Tax=Drosophila persimilis TaxID=7234 RepID=B4HBC3_DROPE|nr:GL15379 [Drosophila persimilis]